MFRRKNTPKHKPTTLRVERLEGRQMMAGDIGASVSGGTLYLTEAPGSAGLEQGVLISQLPGGGVHVSGNATITDSSVSRVNGHAFQDFTGVTNLNVKFGGGGDRVIFDPDPSKTPHFNNVNIDVAAQRPLLMARTVQGGPGSIFNAPDADQVFIWSADTTGSMVINSGNDHDWIVLGSGQFADVKIGGDLTINSGAGADTVNFTTNQRFGVGGKIDIQTYDSLGENDADVAWLDNAVAQGDIRIRTGGGDDLIHLNDSTSFKNINVIAGAGNDQAELIKTLAVDKLMADLGDGNDTLTVDTLYYSSPANVSLFGGNGYDNLINKNNNPSAFSHFNKTGWEAINGFMIPLELAGKKLSVAG